MPRGLGILARALDGGLRCYNCDGDNCKQSINMLPICKRALKCFKSSITIDYKETNVRGCLYDAHGDHRVCNDGLWEYFFGNYAQCCDKPLCNGGPFPKIVTIPMRTFVIVTTLCILFFAIGLIIRYSYSCWKNVFCGARNHSSAEVTDANSEAEPRNQPANLTTSSSSIPLLSACHQPRDQRAAPPNPTAEPTTAQRRSPSPQEDDAPLIPPGSPTVTETAESQF